MNKYIIKYMLPGSAGLSDLVVEEEVEAFSYSTQATGGAGLVADFFEDKERMVPVAATFSRVLSIKKTGTTGMSGSDGQAGTVVP